MAAARDVRERLTESQAQELPENIRRQRVHVVLPIKPTPWEGLKLSQKPSPKPWKRISPSVTSQRPQKPNVTSEYSLTICAIAARPRRLRPTLREHALVRPHRSQSTGPNSRPERRQPIHRAKSFATHVATAEGSMGQHRPRQAAIAKVQIAAAPRNGQPWNSATRQCVAIGLSMNQHN